MSGSAAVWRMSRPEQVLLILVVYAVGVVAAVSGGASPEPLAIAWAAVALLAVSVSVHVINEYADYETDARTRRTAFSGGSGALHELGLPPSFARRTALVAGLIGAGLGLAAVLADAFSGAAGALLALGLVGGWQYSVRPLALSRHGWGEIANALLGGMVLPLYGVAVASGTPDLPDVALFAPFTLVAFVNLLETQWPDRSADASAGKRTLVTRLTPRGVRVLAAAATALAYGLLLPLTPDPMPREVAAASLVALPLSVWAVVRITRRERPLPGVLAMVVLIVAQGLAWLALVAD